MPVGAEGGLEIPFDSAGQGCDLATLNRHAVDIAQHVENQSLTIRADIDKRPGGGFRINTDVPPRPHRFADLPTAFFLASSRSQRQKQNKDGK